MERLKAILADKILDISSGNGDEVKATIDKIQRFRDFANACQTLMIKYPAIEDELVKMIVSGDFDTKVAASRVDSVIRLADIETAQTRKTAVDPEPEEKIILEEVDIDEANMLPKESDTINTPEIDEIPIEIIFEEENPEYYELEEDMDSEEPEVVSEISIEEEVNECAAEEDEFISENIAQEMPYATDTESPTEVEIIYENDEELAAAKRKTIIKRVIQVVGIIIAVVALIFIIKFVISYWQILLIILGVVAVLAILFFWYKRKQS